MSRTMRGIQGVALVLLGAALTGGAAGCGPEGDEGDESAQLMKPATTAGLIGRDFVREAVPVPGVAESTRYRISFSRGSGEPGFSGIEFQGRKIRGEHISASTGCVSVDGPYRIRKGRLGTPFATITGVGCGRAQERFDDRFEKLILGHPGVRFDGEMLVVSGRGQTIRLKEMRQASGDPSIAGTWELGSVRRADEPSGSERAAVRSGTITFDGRHFSYDAACSGSSGTFAISEAAIDFASTRGFAQHCNRETRKAEKPLPSYHLMGDVPYEFDDDGNLVLATKNFELTFERS
jgi:hypothetical protein